MLRKRSPGARGSMTLGNQVYLIFHSHLSTSFNIFFLDIFSLTCLHGLEWPTSHLILNKKDTILFLPKFQFLTPVIGQSFIKFLDLKEKFWFYQNLKIISHQNPTCWNFYIRYIICLYFKRDILTSKNYLCQEHFSSVPRKSDKKVTSRVSESRPRNPRNQSEFFQQSNDKVRRHRLGSYFL